MASVVSTHAEILNGELFATNVTKCEALSGMGKGVVETASNMRERFYWFVGLSLWRTKHTHTMNEYLLDPSTGKRTADDFMSNGDNLMGCASHSL